MKLRSINALFLVDTYKPSHYIMMPEGTNKIYSNLTPRKSRVDGINSVVFVGIQPFVLEYLIDAWNENFFNRPKKEVIAEYVRLMKNMVGGEVVTEHIEKLHDLGYLPLHIKSIAEGTLVPIRVPVLTITNTIDHAFWLVNYLETLLSTSLWQGITSATLAHEFKKLLNHYATLSTGSTDGVEYQGHDFSMRGISSVESAMYSGFGHLLSFVGTDNIPAVFFAETFYGANVDLSPVGKSVPATEHSVMMMSVDMPEDEYYLVEVTYDDSGKIVSEVEIKDQPSS